MVKFSKTTSGQKKMASMLRTDTEDKCKTSSKFEADDRSESHDRGNPIERIFKPNKETGQFGDYGIYL